ncbi:hypothetical protein RRG08_043612 [Elysia crispata]|uniref:Uncharacterized protein n=1 Tax=Elysia crispata TaxID=231223 RepID=A0AAE1A612_9GAST|nr:hypothetical protein RRG08_043612 [Elysia crispata]
MWGEGGRRGGRPAIAVGQLVEPTSNRYIFVAMLANGNDKKRGRRKWIGKEGSRGREREPGMGGLSLFVRPYVIHDRVTQSRVDGVWELVGGGKGRGSLQQRFDIEPQNIACYHYRVVVTREPNWMFGSNLGHFCPQLPLSGCGH